MKHQARDILVVEVARGLVVQRKLPSEENVISELEWYGSTNLRLSDVGLYAALLLLDYRGATARWRTFNERVRVRHHHMQDVTSKRREARTPTAIINSESVARAITADGKQVPNFDLLEWLIALDDGTLDEDEAVELAQYLADSGYAWQLQGRIGRWVADLIESGEVRQ